MYAALYLSEWRYRFDRLYRPAAFFEGFYVTSSFAGRIDHLKSIFRFWRCRSPRPVRCCLFFLLVTIFDTTGTMIGVAEQAGLMKNNKPERAKSAACRFNGDDSRSCFRHKSDDCIYRIFRWCRSWGRTGLTALTVAVMFAVSMFFSPLVSALSGIAAITSPALIIVGGLMMGSVSNMNWKEMDEAFPAFLVILAMPLTSSISTGIALGFISYPIVKAIWGKWREIHPLVIIFAILFFIQLFIL